jgi:hypothetical protein
MATARKLPTPFLLFTLTVWLAGCGGQDSPREPAPADDTAVSGSGEEERREQPNGSVAEAQQTDPSMILPSELKKQLDVSDGAEFHRVGGRIIAASFNDAGVMDLAPLKPLTLKSLSLRSEPVKELDSLQGQMLEELLIFDCEIADLSPLLGTPLQTLVIEKCPVTDISPVSPPTLRQAQFVDVPLSNIGPLANTRLDYLWVDRTAITDLSALKGLPLTKLYVKESPVEDISPLAEMTLEELDLTRTQVTDLTPVRSMELGILWLRGTPVSDLAPIPGSELTSLDVQDTPVADLTPLTGMPTLQRLNIAHTQVTDLTPLKGLHLSRLIFTPANITKGLEAVREMASLRELDVQFEPDVRRTLTPEQFWKSYDAGEFGPAAATNE